MNASAKEQAAVYSCRFNDIPSAAGKGPPDQKRLGAIDDRTLDPI